MDRVLYDLNKNFKPTFLQEVLMFLVVIGAGGVFQDFHNRLTDILTLFFSIICYSNLKEKRYIPKKFAFFYLFILFLVFLSSIFTHTSVIEYLSFVYRPLLAIIILKVFDFKPYKLCIVLYKILKFVCWLAFINFFLTNLLGTHFPILVAENGSSFSSIGYIFNCKSPHYLFSIPFFRNQGIFTEPGILGIMINILLYIMLFELKYNIQKCYLPIFVIISSMSTTGLILLFIQIVCWSFKFINTSSKKNRLVQIIGVIFVFVLFFPLIFSEVSDKMTESNRSTALRYYDTVVGFKMAIDHPLFGIGLSKENYFKMMKNYSVLVGQRGYMNEERGNTNSVSALMCTLGIPITCLYFFALFKQKIMLSKPKIFFIVLLIGLIGEPVYLSNFIFLFLTSSIITIRKKVTETSIKKYKATAISNIE